MSELSMSLTAAGDALTLMAATVLTSGVAFVGIGMACLLFVAAYVGVRLGVTR